MSFNPPPKDCPARAEYQRRDETGEVRTHRIQCERTPTLSRSPWHDGPHRAEYDRPIVNRDGSQSAQVATWS